MPAIAFLSMDHVDEDMDCSDYLVEPHLKEHGITVDTLSWRNLDVDWNRYNLVVIRSTWDYQEAPTEFLQVLRRIDASRARLENPIAMVQWNIDKIYLNQLETEYQVPIIPTQWESRLKGARLGEANVKAYLQQWKTSQIVIKPRISASSENTFWIKQGQAQDWDALSKVFDERDFMVQPFCPEILKEGEYSMVYFGGVLSHVILKTPRDNDFRVQEEFGGRHELVREPPAKLHTTADLCMSALRGLFKTVPLYARLDLVRYREEFVLMEVELVEPSMYLNMDPTSPARFARAIMECLDRSS